MQFTFKRDEEGCERVYVDGVAIAKTNGSSEGFEWLATPPAGVTAEHVYEAAVKADEVGFWVRKMSAKPPKYIGGYVFSECTVDVFVSATTTLSMSNEDDQA